MGRKPKIQLTIEARLKEIEDLIEIRRKYINQFEEEIELLEKEARPYAELLAANSRDLKTTLEDDHKEEGLQPHKEEKGSSGDSEMPQQEINMDDLRVLFFNSS